MKLPQSPANLGEQVCQMELGENLNCSVRPSPVMISRAKKKGARIADRAKLVTRCDAACIGRVTTPLKKYVYQYPSTRCDNGQGLKATTETLPTIQLLTTPVLCTTIDKRQQENKVNSSIDEYPTSIIFQSLHVCSS